MKSILLIVIFLSFSKQNLCGQDSQSKFYPKANGTIGTRQKINALSINTQNETTFFFKILEKRFGKPIIEDRFFRYNCRNKDWSKSKIIIRVDKLIQIDLDKIKSNTLFIYAETKCKHDLLKPNSKSYDSIRSYFLDLFNETIKNGKPDTFRVN